MNELSIKTKWNEPHPHLGMSLMDHLFERLEGIYPSKWRSSFKSPADIQNWRVVWSSSFDYYKITPDEIKRGLNNLPTQKIKNWIPDLGEFIAACRYKEHKEACHQLLIPKLHSKNLEAGRAAIAEMREKLANKMRVKDA